jgi:hypothetical protein
VRTTSVVTLSSRGNAYCKLATGCRTITAEAIVLKALISGVTILSVFAFTQMNVSRSEPRAEARAITALRAVSSAQQVYAHTGGGYAQSLRTLATACPGSSHGFVSPEVGMDPVIMDGYDIRLHATPHSADGRVDCHGTPTAKAYYATAVPVPPARLAMRAFAVDQSGAIWYDTTGTALTLPFHSTPTVRRLQ